MTNWITSYLLITHPLPVSKRLSLHILQYWFLIIILYHLTLFVSPLYLSIRNTMRYIFLSNHCPMHYYTHLFIFPSHWPYSLWNPTFSTSQPPLLTIGDLNCRHILWGDSINFRDRSLGRFLSNTDSFLVATELHISGQYSSHLSLHFSLIKITNLLLFMLYKAL